jgi:O-antigen ligase
MGTYLFVGTLIYFLPLDRNEEGLTLGLSILLRSIIIVIPIGVFFLVRIEQKGLNKLLLEVFLLLFVACLSVPIFMLFGVSFEEKYLLIDYYTRYSGIWANANVAASFINSTIIIGFFIKFRKIIKPIYFYFSYLVMAYCILLTSSNTGLIILLSSSLIYLYYSSVSGRYFSIKSVLFFISLPIIYYGIIWILDYQILKGVGDIVKSQNSINILTLKFHQVNYSSRDYLFFEAMSIIEKNWIIGHGIGYFSRPIFLGNENVMHNYFLTMWGEAGIIGLVNILIFLGFFIYKAYKTNDKPLRFLYAATFSFFGLTFGSGAGLIGNFNLLIYFVTVALISKYINDQSANPITIHK